MIFYKCKGLVTGWHSIVRPPSECNIIIKKVEVRRLEDILSKLRINNVDLLKIDVEGAKPLALKGLGSKLFNVRKIIYEVSDKDEYTPILRNFGFKIINDVDLGDFRMKLALRR